MQKQYPIVVNASIEKTFASITGKDELHKLMEGRVATDFKTANDFQDPVGTKFHQNIAGLVQLDGEVLAYNRPFQFGVGMEIMGLRGTAFYDLEEIDKTHTLMKFEIEFFDATSAKRILLKTMFPLFNRIIVRYVNGIKKVAEQD